MIINIPNVITAFRILLLFPFFITYLNGYTTASFILLLISASTDFFDGHFARKLNQETHIGSILDPIVDKIFAITLYSFLLAKDLIPTWFGIIVLSRNISQLMCIPILSWWLKKSFKVKPGSFAKWATAISDLFVFIPLFFPKNIGGHDVITVFILTISFFELRILITYIPRLIAIATDKHDTFT